MRDVDLFQVALGLSLPFYVSRCVFDAEKKQLDLYIDFSSGERFSCPVCQKEDCPAYDSQEKTWRHLNFFEHVSYLHARTPRISCALCGVKTVNVPWARPESGFTLLFEAFMVTLCQQMPVSAVARLVGEHDTRLWRILHHYVETARADQDYSEIEAIGVDETASARGHAYITTFVDMACANVLFATPGKDAWTVSAFAQDLAAHGGRIEQVQDACCDMSPAFIKGIEKHLPKASITFDKFHVMKLLNQAVDQVRREEQTSDPQLKKSRYIWLKNPHNLTAKQQAKLEMLKLKKLNLKTVRAYQIKLAFQEFYLQQAPLAEPFLKRWYFWATHSKLKPIIEVAKTIKAHWQGILRWFTSRISNGILEGINSLIQAAKAKARGYRSDRNLITIVYLIAGKLNMTLPI